MSEGDIGHQPPICRAGSSMGEKERADYDDRVVLKAGGESWVRMVITYSKSIDQSGVAAKPTRGQLNRENVCFSYLRSRLRIWSRCKGSAVPSRVSLLIIHTQIEYGAAYSRDSSRFPRRRPYLYRQPPSGQSRVYQVTQWYTDDIQCLESAGTGPVVLKVAPVTGAAFSRITMDHSLCASLFLNPLLVQ